jgi:hypothetical protein
LAITETNVVAANGFAQNHQFEIATDFKQYIDAVEACESRPYEIKLVKTDSGLTITNAARSLTEAVNNWCGFDISNLDLLVDMAPVYGYTVDELFTLDLEVKYGPRVTNLMTAQETKFAPTSDETVFKDLIKYAELTGRFPIYVYEPDMSERLYNNFVTKFFTTENIYQSQILKPVEPTVQKKIIYFNKYNAKWQQPIPLLISGQGMMHGGEKSMLIQQAEKVVYFATEVYNNKNIR